MFLTKNLIFLVCEVESKHFIQPYSRNVGMFIEIPNLYALQRNTARNVVKHSNLDHLIKKGDNNRHESRL